MSYDPCTMCAGGCGSCPDCAGNPYPRQWLTEKRTEFTGLFAGFNAENPLTIGNNQWTSPDGSILLARGDSIDWAAHGLDPTGKSTAALWFMLFLADGSGFIYFANFTSFLGRPTSDPQDFTYGFSCYQPSQFQKWVARGGDPGGLEQSNACPATVLITPNDNLPWPMWLRSDVAADVGESAKPADWFGAWDYAPPIAQYQRALAGGNNFKQSSVAIAVPPIPPGGELRVAGVQYLSQSFNATTGALVPDYYPFPARGGVVLRPYRWRLGIAATVPGADASKVWRGCAMLNRYDKTGAHTLTMYPLTDLSPVDQTSDTERTSFGEFVVHGDIAYAQGTTWLANDDDYLSLETGIHLINNSGEVWQPQVLMWDGGFSRIIENDVPITHAGAALSIVETSLIALPYAGCGTCGNCSPLTNNWAVSFNGYGGSAAWVNGKTVNAGYSPKAQTAPFGSIDGVFNAVTPTVYPINVEGFGSGPQYTNPCSWFGRAFFNVSGPANPWFISVYVQHIPGFWVVTYASRNFGFEISDIAGQVFIPDAAFHCFQNNPNISTPDGGVLSIVASQ
jgi:hypothetical protein